MVINSISGGFGGGGTSYSTQKGHLREINSVNMISHPRRRNMSDITFTNRDFMGIDAE